MESTRTVTEYRSGASRSTVPPVWVPDSEPVDHSNSNNGTVSPPRNNNHSSVSNNSITLNTTVNLPPPLTAIPGHPDMNKSLCQRYNETVDSVDWDSNYGFDQSPDECEPELQDTLNNIPADDIEAGIEYVTVHHVFQFLTSHAVGRFILAGVSCFASAATWRLLILVTTHLPIPPQYKVSLLRALDWPKKFTMSLLRSTSAVARGVLIGRRRAVSLELVRPMQIQQADAGLIMRGVEKPPQQQGPQLRRSLSAVLEEEETRSGRSAAQSPLPVSVFNNFKISVKDNFSTRGKSLLCYAYYIYLRCLRNSHG